MKHAEASLQTRKALSAALKEQMTHKPLRKITVNDLITACDLNRKTFYYHFTDIYDLLKWTLEQEAVEVVKQFDLLTNYHDAILFVMNYAEENAHILNCAYDSIGRDELKRVFCSDFYEIADGMIDRCSAECGVVTAPAYPHLPAGFLHRSLCWHPGKLVPGKAYPGRKGEYYPVPLRFCPCHPAHRDKKGCPALTPPHKTARLCNVAHSDRFVGFIAAALLV